MVFNSILKVYHSKDGKEILKNFLISIAKIKPDWTPDLFSNKTILNIKEKIGYDKVILGLSGGVDSTVASVLLHKAIGNNLHCIFVNNGLLRKNEFSDVLKQYEGMGLNVKGVDASNYFISLLNGVSDPEKKRKSHWKSFY
jgi:GMP synthase (glutamine-hydrolysing)